MKLRCQPSSIRLRFLDLDDRAAPIGHAVGNVDVHDDSRLHSLAKLEHRRFTDGRVDVVVVEGVHAERKDNRLAFALARRDGGDMEGRRLVGFAHVTGPFRMEVKAALNAGLFRLRSFETAVARIDVAFENDFGVGQGHRHRPCAL